MVNRLMSFCVSICIITIIASSSYAQGIEDKSLKTVWLDQVWKGKWITSPGASQRNYGVFHFRKTFNLECKPDQFIIHISADNRYRLFVNGNPVVSGPARGDLEHWH